MPEQNLVRPLGVTVLEQTKMLSKLPIKINSEFQMPKVRIQEKNSPREYMCTCCGKSYLRQDGNFLKGGSSILWQGNNGYVPICKSCAETIFNALTDFYSGNEEHALHHWCGIFDYPYDLEASAMTAVQVKNGNSRASLYPAKLNTRQVSGRCTTYLDTVRSELDENMRIQRVNDVVSAANNQDVFVVTKTMTKKWGYGHKPEDYEWLEEQEEDWSSRIECKSKAQEELIRTICLSQLNIQKVQQTGGKVAEAMRAFQDLLASCNLQPRQNAGDDLAEQNTFGTLIRQYEQERPLPAPDPEWEDVDGVKKYIDTWFLGHLCNNLHVSNDYEEQYRREVEKYSVSPPVYDGDDDAVDISLLEKFSNKGDKKECPQ